MNLSTLTAFDLATLEDSLNDVAENANDSAELLDEQGIPGSSYAREIAARFERNAEMVRALGTGLEMTEAMHNDFIYALALSVENCQELDLDEAADEYQAVREKILI